MLWLIFNLFKYFLVFNLLQMTTGPRVTGSEAILKAGVTRTWSEPTSCSSCGAVTPPSLQSPTLQQNTCSAWSPCSSPAGSWRVTELWLVESDHMTWILASDWRVTEHRKQKTLSDFGKNSYLKKLNMNFEFWMPFTAGLWYFHEVCLVSWPFSVVSISPNTY